MKLSVVIPTKNEAHNIEACLDAFEPFRADVELIVVDNFSTDDTLLLAQAKGARCFSLGPERCAQRNKGWREAKGHRVMFVDADMIVSPEAIREILASSADALYVREVRAGSGLRLKARNFERSFYDATCIDGLRVIRRALLEQVGGYDEQLVACEDWDLDRRILALGVKPELTSACLYHNEARQTLRRFLQKKAYYSTSVDAYREKWHNDAICQKQFGLGYRYFGVFFGSGHWKKVLRHPILFGVMMLERVAVGVVYLVSR